MILSPRAIRVFVIALFVMAAAVYLIGWQAPAIGLAHEDGLNLVAAKAIAAGHGYTIESLPQPVPETSIPPLWPAVLALFTLVSGQAQWLKLAPLVLIAGWFAVTFRLLRKMGASPEAAAMLVVVTAFAPTSAFFGTNLLSEALFALLTAGALLMVVEDHPLAAGILAGLAMLTQTAGAALVAASILVFAIRGRFRGAIIFAAAAMALAAPWFGWSLSHAAGGPGVSIGGYTGETILTALPANEKLIVLTHNFLALFESPFELLTGITSIYALIGTGLLLAVCLWFRRQLVPDLFVAFYCLMLLIKIEPPLLSVIPILPLVLWMIWRVLRRVRFAEPLAACLIILLALEVTEDVRRVHIALTTREFPPTSVAGDEWPEMRKIFTWVRANTSPDDVLVADPAPLIWLETGRKAAPGFVPNGYALYYSALRDVVTPDELTTAIDRSRAAFVVMTPDRDFAEGPSYRSSVLALERGGVLEPVAIPGLAAGYRLLRVTH